MAKAVIIDATKIKAKKIKNKKYNLSRILHPNRVVKINETVPFRIKFINIGIEATGPNNVPGIGIQVIGYSNYIL